jgi:hypothetical protein
MGESTWIDRLELPGFVKCHPGTELAFGQLFEETDRRPERALDGLNGDTAQTTPSAPTVEGGQPVDVVKGERERSAAVATKRQ